MAQQKHNTSGYPAPALTMMGDVLLAAFANGILTALCDHCGATDPSSGAPVPWAADEVGRRWLDTSDPAAPVLKRWQQLEASGPVYGWRLLRSISWKALDEPEAVTTVSTSPAAADIAYEEVDLATLLDTLQDSAQVEVPVLAVKLRIRARTGASETIPSGDNGYVAVRKTGMTAPLRKVIPQVQNRWVEDDVVVPLDADETFEFAVDVGGGTPAFEFTIEVLEILEAH